MSVMEVMTLSDVGFNISHLFEFSDFTGQCSFDVWILECSFEGFREILEVLESLGISLNDQGDVWSCPICCFSFSVCQDL